MKRQSAARRLLNLIAVVILTVSGLVVQGAVAPAAVAAPGPVVAADSSTVTADALPTVQIDGVVWSQAIVGGTVYVGGSFANARPAGAAPGTNQTPRANLLAYDLATGALKTAFAPTTNGQVRSVVASPDGSRVYIAGDFTSVSGTARNRVAAFDTATGALIASFAANVDGGVGGTGGVKAIIATDERVYIGGSFTAVNGVGRSRLAAVRASDGGLLTWAPSADHNVNALVLTPDGSKVIVGGSFANVSGVPAYGLAAVHAATGAVLPWAANQTVRNAGPNSAILGLSTDGTNIYGNGYVFGTGGNLEGTFAADPDTGTVHWVEDCHGDTYGNFPVNGVVYTVSHAHACSNIGGFGESVPQGVHRRHAMAFTRQATGTVNHETLGRYDWFGQPSPSIVNWFPDFAVGAYTGQNQAAWTVTGNSQYIVVGGEFPTVNGVGQQGLVRFAVTPIAPGKRGPVLTGAYFMPNLSSPAAGTVRVAFPANYDQDDLNLTYRVVRNGNTAAPVHQTSVHSTFWNRPNIAFTDTNLTPGATYRYRLYAQDAAGNIVAGDNATIVVAGTGSVSAYAQTVESHGALLYWRLGDASGSTAFDAAGASNGTVGSGVAGGARGAIVGDPDTAGTFDGTANGVVRSPAAAAAPNITDAHSTSVWFRTTTRTGGKILGFGDAPTGNSAVYDRHIYLDDSGHLNFGVWPGRTVTLTSPNTYRDGRWHQVVSTLGPGGMVLYVDGQQVAARSDGTSAQHIYGYWRVGGDNLAGWPNRPTTSSFTGDIDEVSVYPTALNAAQVAAQWAASGAGGTGHTPPWAAFTSSTSWLQATVDGSDSATFDGSLASYSWNFGDGSAPVTGVNTAHSYAAAGTYPVTLTVTDSFGVSDTVSHSISVTAPPTTPGAVVSVSPARILDTRAGQGAAGPVPSQGSISVQVTGQGGVPPTGVSAVVVNVTAVTPTAAGFITVWPSGTALQATSNLNFQAGQVIPNLVIVPVGGDGKIQLYNGSAGPVHLLADVAGYIVGGTATTPGAVVSVSPARILDTRAGQGAAGPVPSQGSISVQVTGQGGVPPTGVSAVVVNVTAVTPTAAGFITVWPSGTALQATSNLNFQAGQVIPNLVIVPVGGDGKIQLYNGSAGPVHLLADVAGYIIGGTATTPGAVASVSPARILDTRAGQGAAGPVPSQGSISVQVTGQGGVPPTGVSAVVVNVTAVTPTAAGFITVWPSGTALQATSNLNFQAGQVIPNLVIVPVGGDGKIQLYNGSAGPVHLLADVAGYIIGG